MIGRPLTPALSPQGRGGLRPVILQGAGWGVDGGLSAPHGAFRASPRGYLGRDEAGGRSCGRC